jgi:hypothetical protein
MSGQDFIVKKALAWLLEPDPPSVRFLALRDLLDCPAEDPQLLAAQQEAYTAGPIAQVLAVMHPEGYWAEPGPGYLPKYRSSVWSIQLLAQLGASVEQDERITQACRYILDHALSSGGQFTASGAPSGTADCVQGELLWSLLALGYNDARLDAAFEWMARTVTGEGLASSTKRDASLRYYAGKCGPLFACGSNDKKSCAWGAVKVMLAFGMLPVASRTPLMQQAIQQGVNFLFSVDITTAAYPSGYSTKPSGNWWKFGFPVFYITDLLQIVEALVALGYGRDPRLESAIQLIRDKQDALGRWPLEYDYAGKTWVDFGPKKAPNKWVTLRALRVLKAVR